jgi:Uma2 family endonuclease
MTIIPAAAPSPGPIVYPDSDGKPMADNTKQADWIVLLFSNLRALFDAVADVFVAMDNLWYPVEGHPEVRVAPDVYIVFGRPKGHRGSYKQWEEAGIPLTVVFEVLSPGNTNIEMADKLSFYEDYGVEEYYIYDPDHDQLAAYRRQGEVFRRVRPVQGYVSPRLGIRFDLSGPEMVVFGPDGQPFKTLTQVKAEMEQAQKRAELEQETADQARKRVKRMAELGRRVRRGQASPEELAELERLEEQAAGNGQP